MGKSNRIRANHAEKKIVTPAKRNQKKGMPTWLMSVIAAAVAIIVLGVCVMGVLSSSGVIARHRKAIYSENFKISENMLSYIFQNQYTTFQSNYANQLADFSLDTSKSLRDQKFGDTSGGSPASETLYLGSFEGTWYDYFMKLATEEASQVLLFCEEALQRDIELDDTDKATIDARIDELKETATLYGYTPDSYIAYNYGEGIKLKDVKNLEELYSLATKAMYAVQEDIEAAITDSDITSAYDKDKKAHNSVDYSYFSVNISYKSIAAEVLGKSDYTDAELKEKEAEVLAKYTEEILAAKNVLNELKEKKTSDEFNKHLFEVLAKDYYKDAYAKIELEAADVPETATIDAIKDSIVAYLVEKALADNAEISTAYTEKDGGYTIGEYTVTEKFAKFIDEVQSSVYKSLSNDKATYIVEKGPYTSGTEFSTWAFDDARAVGDTTAILSGDGKDSDEIKNDTGSFSGSVYSLTKTQYRDEDLSKNFAYAVFSSEDSAKKAITAFAAGTASKDNFTTVTTENGATGSSIYENYLAGHLGLADFDSWIFDESTKVGAHTETPIKIDDSNFLVAYYYEDSEPNWKISVKAEIFSERYSEFSTELPNKYSVTLKENVIDNVDAHSAHTH